jgi:serine/threonine protein kinase
MTSSSSNRNTNIDEWVQWIEDGISRDYINYHDYNEFQNKDCIGTGGFGKVYRATWESSNTIVALKSLKAMKENKGLMKEIVNEVYKL